MATYPTVFAGLTPPAADGDVIDESDPVVTNLGSVVTFDPDPTDGTYDCAGGALEYFNVKLFDDSTGDWHVMSGPDGYTCYVGGTVRVGLPYVSAAQAAAVDAFTGLGFNVVVVPAYDSPQPIGYVSAQQDANGVDIGAYALLVTGMTIQVFVSAASIGPVVPLSVGSTPVRYNFTTPNDLILGALKRINSYAPGEALNADAAADGLDTLNELLESWSTDQASVYASAEAILTFTAGKFQYTIGNYDAGTFAGTVTYNSNIITSVSPPIDMVVGGDLTGAGIGPGTYITAIGASTITMSKRASSSPGPQQIGYTICGDFKAERPLRVSSSFTRIPTQTNGLDYPIEVVSQERYIEIGYKGITAPWPIVMWYNPTYPLGVLHFYQCPSMSGELHLFGDIILRRFVTLTERVSMPQGYVRWIKWELARELAPEYGVTWSTTMQRNLMEARAAVRALNQIPVPVAKYDIALMNNRVRSPASWILTGGFD